MLCTTVYTPEGLVTHILMELGVPVHRVGYARVCAAILYFRTNKQQCIITELYPYVAKATDASDWRAVENAIRKIIVTAWKSGNRSAWEKYFPGIKTVPSNKQFIATIAEYI